MWSARESVLERESRVRERESKGGVEERVPRGMGEFVWESQNKDLKLVASWSSMGEFGQKN